jgi:hypothetical protein
MESEGYRLRQPPQQELLLLLLLLLIILFCAASVTGNLTVDAAEQNK